MRRSMSSRFLFDDSESSLPDLENPPDRLRTRSTESFLPFSLPRAPLSTLTVWYSALLSLTTWRSVFLSLICLLACCLIYFLRKILLHDLTVVVILLLVCFLFMITPRTHLWSFCSKKRPVFSYGHEPSAAKKSRINGLGVELLHDGSIYAGEFMEGNRNGRGVMTMPDNSTYGGDWVQGAYHGYGVECMTDHGVYEGQFSTGNRTRYGCMKLCNGDQYKGEWLSGERHGMGKQNYADRSSYEGQFKQGMKHGLGACVYSNGDTYIGDYFNDKRTGVGILYASSGHDTYEGSWHDDQMQGYGIYKRRNGELEAGQWVNGVLTARMPTSDPLIKVTVQAAQKAVRNYEKLQKVEDEVTKAVLDAKIANNDAQLASTRAHYINRLHPFDPRRLLARFSSRSITASFQDLRRRLGNFGRSIANLARFMAGRL